MMKMITIRREIRARFCSLFLKAESLLLLRITVPLFELKLFVFVDARHTVKFLGFTQKKMYNEFYAGNHLV